MSREATKIDAHVGTRIRMRRIELKMSQQTLGATINVSFQQIQKYEKGINRVGAGRMQAVANALGCAIGFFYENAPGKRGGGDTSEMSAFMTSPDGVALAQAFMSLPDDGKLRRNVRDVVIGIAACQSNLKASRARAA